MTQEPRRLDGVPPLFVYRAVVALRDLLARLMRRIVPARVAVFDQFTGVWRTQMIYVAAKLGVADQLVAGPLGAEDLAARVGADAHALGRVLRALVSIGIFEQRSDGRFALNRMGETLRSDRPDSLRDIVMFLGSRHSMAGWAHFYEAVKNGGNGFEVANGKPVFEWFDEHPAEGAVFHGGMVNMTELDAPALVRGYDWSRFRTVCDVAGGRGLLLAAILSENHHLNGILFDAAHVVAGAGPIFEAWGVRDRATTVSGSFFDEVPAGSDAYVLKEIVHDWDDARCLEILEVCRRAMQPGATLLVMEMVLVDGPLGHAARLLDMEMLDANGQGRQRTEAEFRALFDATGFRFTRIVPVAGAPSIVEAVAA